MLFKGRLKVAGDRGEGIPVDLTIDDVFVDLWAEGEELGRWRMDVVDVSRLHGNEFSMLLDGENMIFVAADPLGFAYDGMNAIGEVSARLRKRRSVFGRRSKPDKAPAQAPLVAEPPAAAAAPTAGPAPPPTPAPPLTIDDLLPPRPAPPIPEPAAFGDDEVVSGYDVAEEITTYGADALEPPAVFSPAVEVPEPAPAEPEEEAAGGDEPASVTAEEIGAMAVSWPEEESEPAVVAAVPVLEEALAAGEVEAEPPAVAGLHELGHLDLVMIDEEEIAPVDASTEPDMERWVEAAERLEATAEPEPAETVAPEPVAESTGLAAILAQAAEPTEPPAPPPGPAAAPLPAPEAQEKRGRRRFGRNKEPEAHEHEYQASRTVGGITRRVCGICGHVSFQSEDVYQGWS